MRVKRFFCAMNPKETTHQTHCLRCGTCCEKGGPALHTDDLELVLRQSIPATALYTIRRGELVRDNINGGLFQTRQEIVKIKSTSGTSACTCYEKTKRGCRIYESRPIECRAMACWATSHIEAIYAMNRLDRSAVFGRVQWLMELIGDHESRCSYARLHELVRRREHGESRASEEILEIVRYDAGMRAIFAEKTGLDAGMVDFVFGRPLSETIPTQFGIRLYHH